MTEKERCLNYAYYLLARQDRTKAKMLEKFSEKGYEEGVSKSVIDFLLENGLIDDERFAVNYILSRRHIHGNFRMKQALRQKGIGDAIFERALTKVEDEEEAFDEARVIDGLIEKKCNQIALDRERLHSDYMYKQKSLAKITRFLAGRGFGASAIRDGLSRVLSEDGADEF